MTSGHITTFVLGALVAAIAWHWGAEFAAWLAQRRKTAQAPRSDADADALLRRVEKAERSLLAAGYTDQGGEAWKPPMGPAAAPSSAPAKPTWSPMLCGTRLELGATGFWIAFRPRSADGCPFHGYSPENRRLIWGHDLASMKRVLENMAAERAEFAPAPVLPRGETPGR